MRRLLKPENETLLADILSDVADSGLRADLEAHLRKRLAAREDRADANQKVFNDAYHRALALGIEDPDDFAQRAVKLDFMRNVLAMKVAALRKASSRMAANEANRNALENEAASRTASPDQRRNPQRDREYLEIVGSEERAGRLQSSGLVGAKIQKRLGNYRLPHWEKTTLPLKVMALSMEAHMRGGRTINLRLGHEFRGRP